MQESNSQVALTIPSLNGLRAISVLLVVVSHAGFGQIVPGGLGVTTFFFLSGYLITSLMFAEYGRTGAISIIAFYARRVFRLLPPLIVTLAIAYGLVLVHALEGSVTLSGFAAQLLYFANYYAIFFDPGSMSVPRGTGVLWSLAVEEHFYIFFPIVMIWMLSQTNRQRNIILGFSGLALVILAWRIYLVHSPDFVVARTYYASDTRIDSIIYGAILSVSKDPTKERRELDGMSIPQWCLFACAIGVLLFTMIYRQPQFRETFRYSLQGIALLPIFYFAIRFHDNMLFRHLNSNWAARIGVYSYAIYLIHSVIISILGTHAPSIANRPLLLLAVVLPLSMTYAAAIDSYVDPYFRRLRYKYRA